MPSDVSAEDIVNYILQIKCLLGEFYSFAAFNESLPFELRGGGSTFGGAQARLTPGMQVRLSFLLPPASILLWHVVSRSKAQTRRSGLGENFFLHWLFTCACRSWTL